MTAYAFIFVLIIASSLIINKGFGLFKRSNKVKNTGTEKIRSMTMGRTELKGKSLPIGESREIPFTEGRCVRLEWNIKEYRESSTDEDSKEWKTIASGEYKNPFILDDGSGKTYIDTEDQNPVWKYSEKSTQKWNSRILYRPFYNYLRWFEKYPSEEVTSPTSKLVGFKRRVWSKPSYSFWQSHAALYTLFSETCLFQKIALTCPPFLT